MLLIFVPFFFSKTFRKTNILYLMFFFCLFQKFNIFIGEFSLQTKPVLLSEDSLEKVQTKPVLLSEDRRLPGKSSNKASFVVRRQKTPWRKFKRSQYCCQEPLICIIQHFEHGSISMQQCTRACVPALGRAQ